MSKEKSQSDAARRLEITYKEQLLKDTRDEALAIALGYLSTRSEPYITPELGMDPATSFDCSGFVSHVFSRAARSTGADIIIPRHANEQWRLMGESVAYTQRAPGDLVFFPSRKKDGLRVMGHVGIVLGEMEYIHAPGKKSTAVRIDPLPAEPELLDDIQPNDLYTHTPAGIKRLSLPLGDGRWHVY